MVLTDTDIVKYIKEPHNKHIADYKDEHVKLDTLYSGGDVASLLEQVKNYENRAQKDLRNKVARSTKDLLSNLLNPMGKVFSASGFNTEVKIDSAQAEETFLEHIELLPEGISMKKWMEVYWKDAYITDPNGVCFVEVEDTKNPKAYPTYKSILTIHDYKMKWNDFEYIIFEHGEVILPTEEKLDVDKKTKTKVYRVFDDEKDGLYYVKGEQLYEFIEEGQETSIIKHNYGFVPAVLCSDIIDKKTKGRLPFINKIDEVLEEYLRDSSVHSIYKFLHGFPIFWRYSTKCTTCLGTGKIDDPESTTTPKAKIKCPTCSGTGTKITSDVSDAITMPLPKEGQPKLAPDIAGYVQPDLETWKMQLEELKLMTRDMHFALWGTYTDDEKSETATGRFIDEQPVQDTLMGVSATCENIDERLSNFMGKIMFGELFNNIDRKYGRRFLIETPDVIWEKYAKAREQQAPITTLDYLYKQFLMAEYHNDSVMMERKMNEFYLEPFPHYSLEDLVNKATQKQLQRKILFSEWVATDVDFSKKLEQLRTDFDKYVTDNSEINEPVEPVPSPGTIGQGNQA